MATTQLSEFARADGSIDLRRALDAGREERESAMLKIARGRVRLFKPQRP